jgi:RNA polymerase sporulation-specific sigma factor
MKTTSTEKQISIEDLLKKYQRYLIKVASTLTKDDYIKEELIQVASIGLFKAYQLYDESKGELHYYLISYIRGSMLTYLTTNTRTIKIPANVIIDNLNNAEGNKDIRTISIETSINEYGDTIQDRISIEEDDNSLDDQQEAIRSLLRQYVSQLKERYQLILKLRYFEEKTIEEIGQALGISRQAVDLQLTAALHQLQDKFGVERKRLKGERMQKQKTPDNK